MSPSRRGYPVKHLAALPVVEDAVVVETYDSDVLTQAELEDAAMLLMAADARLGSDWWSAQAALEWARRAMASLETDPLYVGGLHHGDCTKHAHTCLRCVVERYRAEAQARFDAD